jgi:hypothetical protein
MLLSTSGQLARHSKSGDIDLKHEFMPLCHLFFPKIKIDMKRSFNGVLWNDYLNKLLVLAIN